MRYCNIRHEMSSVDSSSKSWFSALSKENVSEVGPWVALLHCSTVESAIGWDKLYIIQHLADFRFVLFRTVERQSDRNFESVPCVMQGLLAEAVTGIYAGFASIGSSPTVYKMCMSIGWNPFYKNEQKTVEPWILHDFDKDFYGKTVITTIQSQAKHLLKLRLGLRRVLWNCFQHICRHVILWVCIFAGFKAMAFSCNATVNIRVLSLQMLKAIFV